MIPFAVVRSLLPGILLSACFAMVAQLLAALPWVKNSGLSPLTLAIILGIVAGNTFYPKIANSCGHGITFSRQKILRLGVIFFGLRLTVQNIVEIGIAGILLDAFIVSLTFLLAYNIGTRWLGIEKPLVILIGAGASICGAAAVLATEPIARARAEQVAVAVATVVVFGTLAMFLYPVLYVFNVQSQILPGGAHGFGLYIGATVHEVAQVIVAAKTIGESAVDVAVIAKMVRVMMLAPFLMILAFFVTRFQASVVTSNATSWRNHVPWFALGFIAVVLFNSLHLLPKNIKETLLAIDMFLLTMAMSALGLATHISAIKKAGIRPLLLAAILFIWLVIGGGLLHRVFSTFL